MTLQYNSDNYVDLLHVIAGKMQLALTDNTLYFPDKFGKGFMKAALMPHNMSVLTGDLTPAEDIVLERFSANATFYALHFVEVPDYKSFQGTSAKDDTSIYFDGSTIALVNAQLEARYVLRGGVNVRFVLMLFERKLLLQYMDEQVVDLFLSTYFSKVLKKGNTTPIDADFRELMFDLVKADAHHPLITQYTNTRCLLLLERFIIRFMHQSEQEQQLTFKLNADEISRLMRVESRLVKDYSQAPPTIEVLSKAAAMSPTKLKKDFKQLYGLPIYEYYQKNRMKKAHSLLSENNYSIKEVGIMVGYTNLSHFAVSFKKEFGILPSELSHRDEVLPMDGMSDMEEAARKQIN